MSSTYHDWAWSTTSADLRRPRMAPWRWSRSASGEGPERVGRRPRIWRKQRLGKPNEKLSSVHIIYIYIPVGSMYGIYANIWGILMENVIIHGSHGIYHNIFITTVLIPFSGSDPWVWWCETTGFHPGFFAKPVGHPTTWRLTWLLLVGKSKYKLVYARI